MTSRMITLLFVGAITWLWSSDAQAGFITQSAFDSTATIYNLDNLGYPTGNLNAPVTVGLLTLTTDDGQLRYVNFGLNNSNALGNNTDLGFINIALSTGAHKFGFLVGLAGEAQVNAETIAFFDTNNNLLGSVNVSKPGGFTFVGFEDVAGLIGRALITDTDLNSTIVSVDNLQVQGVPEPSSFALMAAGLLLLSQTRRLFRIKHQHSDA
jgi:hypothetical protein